MALPRYKIPQSVLVVIYTPALEVLLLCRVQDVPEGGPFWQSVTGSKDFPSESWAETARREVWEETGIRADTEAAVLEDWELENVYAIYPQWQHRYAPGVWRNAERVFGLCVASPPAVRLSPQEHSAYCWLPWREAALRCYSASNAEAILQLPQRAGAQPETRRSV
ncbi:MAG: dihydroneopterin triphosphate diphosphatase [Rhodoferax sp.]|nr:MAG: dihydroneopterin triphosphate diphosphatase [Rhodoferax sp.]